MIKIHKTELLKVFILYEALLVALPIAIIGLSIFILHLAENLLQFTSTENHDFYCFYFMLTVHTFITIMSLYFIPPTLFASQLFRATTIGFIPKSVAAWIITIGIYSLIALFFAIIMSLYKASNKQNDSTKGYTINPIRKKTI